MGENKPQIENINTVSATLITHIQMTMRTVSDDHVALYLSAMIDGIKALQERVLSLPKGDR